MRHTRSPLTALLAIVVAAFAAPRAAPAADAPVYHAGADVIYAELFPRADPGSSGGIYDPSLAYDDAGIGWLAFSSVGMANGSVPYVHTRLAVSGDFGA